MLFYNIEKYIKILCLREIMMAYIRNKKIKGKTYYYVVEGKLDKRGKVKQKVIMYLGNIGNILKVFKFYKEHN